MEPILTPIIIRGVERCIIALGAVFIVYLGYRLFIRGIDKGRGELRIRKSVVGDIVFSGTGPGVFFMVFGALVLLAGLLKGGVGSEVTRTQWHTALPSTSGMQTDGTTLASAPDPNRCQVKIPVTSEVSVVIGEYSSQNRSIRYNCERDRDGQAWLCLETERAHRLDPNTHILKDEPGKQKGTQ